MTKPVPRVTWTATPLQVERVIAAVLPHASGDTTLPTLNSIRIELDGHRFLAMATDRYSLGVCRADLKTWDEKAKRAKPVTAQLPPSDLKRLFTFLRPTRTVPADWTLTADALTVVADGNSLTIHAAEGENYPKWRSLFDSVVKTDAAPGTDMAFTPRVVDHFHKSAKALGHVSMRWRFTTPLKPVIVEIGEDFVGMLMPCRISSDAPVLDLAVFGIEPKAVAVSK